MGNHALSVFTFQHSQIRTLDQSGEIWFVATDVSNVLGYEQAKDMTRHVDDEDKGFASVPTPGGNQRLTIINESGLYAAVLRSRRPEARSFKRWVTAEVLPAIRRTGGYARNGAEQLALAEQIGALRDQLQMQNALMLGLYGKLDRAQRGHISALGKLERIASRDAAREGIDTVVRMLAAGYSHAAIEQATGKKRNYIRQIAFRARGDGRLTGDAVQANLPLEA